MENGAEIMNSSTLVVRESQVALFVHKGEIADVFGPGTYKLSTENIPFLTKLLSLSTAGNSRIKAEVYFINTIFTINIIVFIITMNCVDT